MKIQKACMPVRGLRAFKKEGHLLVLLLVHTGHVQEYPYLYKPLKIRQSRTYPDPLWGNRGSTPLASTIFIAGRGIFSENGAPSYSISRVVK
jgi:hypothetical protein